MTTAAGPSVSDDAAAEDTPDGLADRPVDRFHNRENPSPAEMAEMLREVQDCVAALDERLAGVEGAQGDSSAVTRRLALSVAQMAETLARRVRSLETGGAAPAPAEPGPASKPPPLATPVASRGAPAGPPKVRRADTWVLIVGFAVLVGLVAIGLWVFGRQAAGGSPAKPSAVVAPAALAPRPVVAPVAAPPQTVQATASRAAPAPRRRAPYPARRPAARQTAPTAPIPAAAQTPSSTPAPAPAGFRSFGPAAANSAAKPAATNGVAKPPSS